MSNFSRYISKDFPIEGSSLRLDDKEKAWEQIDGRMRTAVRKGQKSGAVIRRVKGTKKEMEAFKAFCLNPDDLPPAMTDRYHLYFASLQDELVAGILLVEVGDKLFMLCHASTPAAKEAEIPSLLIWHMVQEWSEKRFRCIDIGASYRASLQKFFSGWATKRYPMIMKPPELNPDIRLTPFDTQAMDIPVIHDASNIVDTMLTKKFAGKPHTFFPRAMYAVFTLIKSLAPKEVWITTTTDTHYVSSCVTSAIEQSSPWKRELTENTQAIFCIHEFGFPHPNLRELRKIADERGIPLIEDCAYGWSTTGIGGIGDYAIYSLTKAFPLQFGGYLVGKAFRPEELWHDYGCSDEGKRIFTEARLAYWLKDETASTEKRRGNYRWFLDLFGETRTYFPLSEGVEPGAFILRVEEFLHNDTHHQNSTVGETSQKSPHARKQAKISRGVSAYVERNFGEADEAGGIFQRFLENERRMEEVSSFVRGFGIECGNYWKNSAIILPVHQRLAPAHVEYIAGSVLATEREWCGVPHPPHGAHRPRR